ncbi:MAG: Tfp pilus assembly protein PilX [Flavobacteriales bacterium]|jgi:Tfp pilus assembly protein PilX
MKNDKRFNRIKNESGATLVVALVLLAAISIVGVAGMQSTSLEMKMITSTKQRHESFAYTEAALIKVEDQIRAQMKVGDPRKLFLDDGATVANRFSSDCTNGRCFNGSYDSTDIKGDFGCDIWDESGERVGPYLKPTIWGDSNFHQEVDLGIDGVGLVKYIVEFMCFVPELDIDGNAVAFSATEGERTGDAAFRITVYTQAINGVLAPVMLQSTIAVSL